MTDDLERRLRDLLQHAQLPSAPDRLHARVADVAAPPTARPRSAFGARWLLLPIAALLAIALGAGLLVVGGPPSQTSVTARSGDFQLTLTTAKSEYPSGEAIDVSASVEYTGPNDSVEISARQDTSGYADLLITPRGLVYFTVEQLDGSLSLGGPGEGRCYTATLTKGRLESVPIGRAADYYPGHPLPAGTYRITAHASFGLTSCDQPIDLSASLVITVSKYAASPSPPPSLVTPSPTPMPSNACGGFHLKVVNEDTGSITVTINGSYAQMVDGGTSQTIVEWLPPNKPLMPWTVVVTAADGTRIGSAYMTGPVDQKIIISGGQMEYGPYDIRTDGCG
jgi:hypothetical protein